MELLDNYFTLQKQIYDYFEYKEDWVVIPIDDRTKNNWFLIQYEQGGGGTVYYFNENSENLLEDAKDGRYCSCPVYTQQFLDKWVYRKDDYTMISVDTQTDGNKFLMIFDNSKEIKDSEIIDFCDHYV